MTWWSGNCGGRGRALPAKQDDITLTGHAIEARLYVEDPYTGFTPQTGTVLWWQPERAVQGDVAKRFNRVRRARGRRHSPRQCGVAVLRPHGGQSHRAWP